MSTSPYETIILTVEGPIATLTMNRPERFNSMSNLMLREARIALEALAQDRSVRVLVLTGTGRSFCPGADIKGVADGSRGEIQLELRDFEVPVLLHEMPQVTIAAVNGACAGAGFGWAAACDFRLAARSAKFNSAFLDVGVAGDMSMPWTLPRLLGGAKARELFFLPDKFTADDALRIGLVSKVVDDEELPAATAALAQRLAAAAPIALRTMKANFVAAESMSLLEFSKHESERHMEMFTTHDTREAFMAKAEKRAPRFEDR